MNQEEGRTQATPKRKTQDELRRDFVEKCAKIEEEHPEIAYKDGWSELHETLKTRDEKDIKKHFENIDTLLVFAGLYSAILTAFLVEAYKLLQLDSSDASLQVLLEISRQLGSFAVTSGFANATYVPSLPTGSFTPKRSSVWLNGLWFVALILSLATASLGLLVKQWLREYADNPGATPEEQRRIRLFRVRGLRRYKVSEIATFLPLLLQISLILFFSGLVLFTRGVHATIGWVIMGFVVVWGMILVITTILPWFSASCPYKTPFLKPITLQFKRLLDPLNTWLRDSTKCSFRWIYDKLPRTLLGDDAETKASKEFSFDVDVLLDIYETSGSANVWEMIMHSVDLKNSVESFTNLCSVILARYGDPAPEFSTTLARKAWRCLPPEHRGLFLKSLSTCIRSRLSEAFENKERSELDEDTFDMLFLLNERSDHLSRWSSSRMDGSLVQMSSAILHASLSVPFTRGSLVKYASGLLESGVGTLRRWEYFDKSGEYRATTLRSLRFSRHCLAMSAFIEASNQVFKTSSTLEDEAEVTYPSLSILFCARRSTEGCWPVLKNKFRHLSGLIARKMDPFRNPSGPQHVYYVFQWHCILGMALRLHKRIPDIIDKTLFEVLHTRSVKMFNLYVKYEENGELATCIRGKPEQGLTMSDASIRSINWDEVLDNEVVVRGRREYTEYEDKWDYQRLQADYKHRMEFILNYEWCWDEEIRQMVSDYKF